MTQGHLTKNPSTWNCTCWLWGRDWVENSWPEGWRCEGSILAVATGQVGRPGEVLPVPVVEARASMLWHYTAVWFWLIYAYAKLLQLFLTSCNPCHALFHDLPTRDPGIKSSGSSHLHWAVRGLPLMVLWSPLHVALILVQFWNLVLQVFHTSVLLLNSFNNSFSNWSEFSFIVCNQ